MKRYYIIPFIVLFFCALKGYSQTMTVTLAGAGNFTVPCGVSSISVDLWGGGGGGGGDNTNGGNKGCGGGGGGFTSSVLAVTPGQTIAYSVGAGGAAGASGGGAGTAGGNSTFGALTANGGGGGGGPAGAGGTAGTGTTANGTAGTSGVTTGVGGAAGGAGGGAGGAAAAAGNAGNVGTAPGGGGSGGNDNSALFNYAGGAGGAGRITVTYSFASAGSDQNLAACVTSGTLNATAVPAGSIGTWSCVTNCAGVSIANPNSPTSTFAGLTIPNSTTFRWTVTDDPGVAGGGGCTSTTDDVVINTLNGALCPTYCTQDADMNCASFTEAITGVIFRTINNSSTGCNEPGTSTTVTPGQTSAFTITTVGSGTYDLSIHIDWNADGDFLDASEFILVGNNVNPGTFTGNITVPAGATCDAAVRMRVIWNYSANTTNATACATNLTYGEQEDYTLNISCCTPNCSNGIQDCNELGVDCGGPCGAACPGVASCTDAVQNQDETGVDCGGLVCAPCGAACATFSGMTSNPVEGSTIDATGGNQSVTTCVEVTYSNRGTNWLHGVFVNPASTGFVSSSATGAVPEPNYNSLGTVYQWRALTNNFTGQTSGNSITQDGWFVGTSAADNDPGNNLGWPDGAGTTFGPFCFTTILSCTGLTGDVAGSLSFQATGDSFSGSWTNIDCGKETSFGANVFHYTLHCPNPLPIELIDFTGNYIDRNVKLSWSTSSETENDYFTLFRSYDGVKFEDIGKIDGAPGGYSSEKRDYFFYDDKPGNEMTYYKVKQVDFNGEVKESKMIGIISPMSLKEVAVVPNPVQDNAMVVFKTTEEQATAIEITDLAGNVIESITIDSKYGINTYAFDTKKISAGIYFVKITNNLETQKIKFIKE